MPIIGLQSSELLWQTSVKAYTSKSVLLFLRPEERDENIEHAGVVGETAPRFSSLALWQGGVPLRTTYAAVLEGIWIFISFNSRLLALRVEFSSVGLVFGPCVAVRALGKGVNQADSSMGHGLGVKRELLDASA